MDVSACLAELLEWAASVLNDDDDDDDDDARRAAELVQAMDGWMCRGGFPPGRWKV